MDSQLNTPSSDKNLQAAIAVVDAALLGVHEGNNVSLHPRLKKIIAQEIARRPSLTPDLFSPDFFSKFLKRILESSSL